MNAERAVHPAGSPPGLSGELERGPRGVLYWVRDPRSGRIVSVRVPPPLWPLEASMLAAARARSLKHPHIAPVMEAGWRDGAAYITLCEELGFRVNPAALSPREAAMIVRDVATALDYAAGRGVVHPGPIPDVLRFTPAGRVVVTGYELPRGGDVPDLYLAPEVREGAPVDAAANVYSLGAILYVFVEGSRPGPRALKRLKIMIREAMHADPRRRPSAAGLAAALSRWLKDPDSIRPIAEAAEFWLEAPESAPALEAAEFWREDPEPAPEPAEFWFGEPRHAA